jgi:two-component system, OmpR family, sensor histidine kinase PhoQ
VSVGLVLAAFFAIVALVLEQSFRESAEQALKETLQVQIYSLLSVAELNNAGELKMPPSLREPRFENPGSGLYAFIQQPKKKLIWHSQSAIGLDPISPPELKAGDSAFFLDDHDRYALHYAVIWQNLAGVERAYIFTVAEDARFLGTQLKRFQTTLRFWLLVIGVVLVFIQFAVLRWNLKPLRIIVRDLEAVEKGQKTQLDGQYATELEGLAGHLNAFINSERIHMERYRNSLADLAHSLKTPLAILRGCVESFNANKSTVQEQISRIDEIVEYQLQRAAAKGEHKSSKSVDLSEIIKKITSSLQKVYIDKRITIDINAPEPCQIYCGEGDLYEIVGNLMDNACKWCQHKVRVSVSVTYRKGQRKYSLIMLIEDDGPGIPPEKLHEILERGVRADENIHGHGIGMTVVNELVGLLGGKLEGGKSALLGGMRWSIYLP